MARFSDISSTLASGIDGDLELNLDEDAISNSLYNIFATMKGDRRMLPYFASNVHRLLFEPMDNIVTSQLKSALYDAVIFWEPRIKITVLYIQPNYEKNEYYIKMEYYIKDLGLYDKIDYILQKL